MLKFFKVFQSCVWTVNLFFNFFFIVSTGNFVLSLQKIKIVCEKAAQYL